MHLVSLLSRKEWHGKTTNPTARNLAPPFKGGGVGINRKSGCLGQSALTQPKERGRELNKLSKFVVFCFVNEFGYKTVKS